MAQELGEGKNGWMTWRMDGWEDRDGYGGWQIGPKRAVNFARIGLIVFFVEGSIMEKCIKSHHLISYVLIMVTILFSENNSN